MVKLKKNTHFQIIPNFPECSFLFKGNKENLNKCKLNKNNPDIIFSFKSVMNELNELIFFYLKQQLFK